ncbi:MAG: Lrp/AsnC family transcriptional regulator [Pseudomonadota bacterium]
MLRELQRDATLSLAELSDRVGLSQTPCWKRVKKLESEGIIARRVTLLDRERLGVGATLFVSLRTSRHDEDWLEHFAETVSRIPEVTEFYRMSGEVDYLLKIVCRDIADYDRIYKQIIQKTNLADVSASFAMEQIKYTTEIPI